MTPDSRVRVNPNPNPDSTTDDILIQLHISHQGIEKTQHIYWKKMNDDIERASKSCSVCAEHQDANPKEALKPHEIPSKPWQSIASDLFEINGHQPTTTC
jgi:hypothetical protein